MSKSNKQIVQEFYNRLNEHNVEKIWEYIDDNFEYALETWIERGVYLKTEGEKAIVREVSPDAPGAEKLQPGDEVVRVQEAGRIYETFEAIRYDAWGLNPKEKFNIQVRRDGELFDYEITPVVVKMDGKIVRIFEVHNVATELRQQGYRFIPPDA